jgi:RNA polymerase sigma-70 factor, ECF subfamily
MGSALDHSLATSSVTTDRQTRRARSGVSDGALLVAVGRGDRRAFEELHARYARAVLGLSLNRLGDRGRAEDAVQDAFAAIWRSAATYQPDRGPGAPWLYAVARNAITNRWRERLELPLEPWEEPSTEPGPDSRAEQAWRSFCVHRALETLPDHQRSLIELAYWGGLSQTEIASRLQIPLGTVKTRTRAALSRLAVALKEDMQ